MSKEGDESRFRKRERSGIGMVDLEMITIAKF
jgi:hypothetical protein